MQNMFLRLAASAVLTLSLSSSLFANDDLLSLATNGEVVSSFEAVNTTDAIKLSDTQMSDVRGGYIMSISRYTVGGNIRMAVGQLSEKINGKTVYAVARQLPNQASTAWIAYKEPNGNLSQAVSPQGFALQAQYSNQIKSFIR